MIQIPDAPWIREAEMYGYPDGPEIDPKCPVCGKECDSIYTTEIGDALGCDNCIQRWEPYDYWQEVMEDETPD